MNMKNQKSEIQKFSQIFKEKTPKIIMAQQQRRVAYYFHAASVLTGFQAWDTAVDFIFLFDILLNLNTGFIILKDQVRFFGGLFS